MADYIQFTNPITSKIKNIKVGWSWTLFFFSGIGVPLFIRGLHGWGVGMIIFNIIIGFISEVEHLKHLLVHIEIILRTLLLILSINLGINGNEMGKKELLKKGWVITKTYKIT